MNSKFEVSDLDRPNFPCFQSVSTESSPDQSRLDLRHQRGLHHRVGDFGQAGVDLGLLDLSPLPGASFLLFHHRNRISGTVTSFAFAEPPPELLDYETLPDFSTKCQHDRSRQSFFLKIQGKSVATIPFTHEPK